MIKNNQDKEIILGLLNSTTYPARVKDIYALQRLGYQVVIKAGKAVDIVPTHI